MKVHSVIVGETIHYQAYDDSLTEDKVHIVQSPAFAYFKIADLVKDKRLITPGILPEVNPWNAFGLNPWKDIIPGDRLHVLNEFDDDLIDKEVQYNNFSRITGMTLVPFFNITTIMLDYLDDKIFPTKLGKFNYYLKFNLFYPELLCKE